MAEAVVRNARIREEGTRNLLTAAAAAGAHRLVAQSIAWAYATGAGTRIGRIILWSLVLLAAEPSACAALRRSDIRHCRRRRSPMWCFVMGSFTGPEPASMQRSAPFHSMSMLRPTLRCLASTRAHPASSTLSNRMTPPKRQPHSWAGVWIFVCSGKRIPGRGALTAKEGDGDFQSQAGKSSKRATGRCSGSSLPFAAIAHSAACRASIGWPPDNLGSLAVCQLWQGAIRQCPEVDECPRRLR